MVQEEPQTCLTYETRPTIKPNINRCHQYETQRKYINLIDHEMTTMYTQHT